MWMALQMAATTSLLALLGPAVATSALNIDWRAYIFRADKVWNSPWQVETAYNIPR